MSIENKRFFFGSNASHIIEFQFGTRSQNSSAAAAAAGH